MVRAVKNLYALPPHLRFFAEPFEVWMSTACLVTGITAAAGKTRPQSLAAQLSPWLLHGWGVLLCLGGATTLLARWRIGRPQTDLGLLAARSWEVAGLTALATAIGAYALAALAAGVAGLTAGSMTAGAAWTFAVRAWIVSRELKKERAGETGTNG